MYYMAKRYLAISEKVCGSDNGSVTLKTELFVKL
jgi:hypothetical protein